MLPNRLEAFLAQSPAKKTSTEPAIAVGATTGTVAGLFALVAYLFPPFLSQHTTSIIFVACTFLLPIITAVFTRGKVWSPMSVLELVNEALEAAEEAEIRGKNV